MCENLCDIDKARERKSVCVKEREREEERNDFLIPTKAFSTKKEFEKDGAKPSSIFDRH
jgi:hypothetical protein